MRAQQLRAFARCRELVRPCLVSQRFDTGYSTQFRAVGGVSFSRHPLHSPLNVMLWRKKAAITSCCAPHVAAKPCYLIMPTLPHRKRIRCQQAGFAETPATPKQTATPKHPHFGWVAETCRSSGRCSTRELPSRKKRN